jgi:hypothetical protein
VADRKERRDNRPVEQRMSGFGQGSKDTDLLDFSAKSLGQNCPSHCPQHEDSREGTSPNSLGDPIPIGEVAQIIGCSVWTVRQRCMRQGLPYYRASRTGRLIFYRDQVVQWLIENQTERRW